MKTDKRVIALFLLTLVVVGGYLPYKLGYWSIPSLPVKVTGPVISAFLGENSIRNVRIIAHTDYTIKVGMDVHYNGEFGTDSAVQVTLITSQHGHDYVYGKGVLPVKPGDTSGEAVIYKPRTVKDELTINKIRLGFYKGRIQVNQDPDVFSVVDTHYTLPSEITASESKSPQFWKSRIAVLFYSKDYDTLDRLVEDWNNPQVRDINGKWRLDLIKVIDKLHGIANQWDNHLAMIHEARKRLPRSAAFALIEAGYWIQYAWNARGSGYANSVTDTGRQLFRERLVKAEQVLRESKSYASDNPVWYERYLTVAMAMGWSKEDIVALFAEAIKRHPDSYQIYFNAANALSPKWGGSKELLDMVARAADRVEPAPENDVIYARVYWAISGVLSENKSLFDDSLVSWVRMKAGFRQLLKDYPDSDWNLNNFGRFACKAGDRSTYLEIRNRMGTGRIVQDVWKGNTSLEACDRTLLART